MPASISLRLLIKLCTACCPRLVVALGKSSKHLREAGRILAQRLTGVKKKRQKKTGKEEPAKTVDLPAQAGVPGSFGTCLSKFF
jgi:hypothetical protein